MTRQIHVTSGTSVQTLAALDTAEGVTLLSTFGIAAGLGTTEMHIPAAALPWLARVVREKRHRPVVHAIERRREKASADG